MFLVELRNLKKMQDVGHLTYALLNRVKDIMGGGVCHGRTEGRKSGDYEDEENLQYRTEKGEMKEKTDWTERGGGGKTK